ncbi:MAG TPA: arginyltransferase [Dongiaceae bacterium]|jgi:arginine-tRNA-protein transferase|nr:arginyltransferase [Dongiaceae bacterium]
MTSLASPPQMQFLVTGETACPYLPGRRERKLITELPTRQTEETYTMLAIAGFRRTHYMAYRPACRDCNACVPVRIPIADFHPHRTHRRILNRNADLKCTLQPTRASVEYFHLFCRYMRARHPLSDMGNMNYGDFRAMLEEAPIPTLIVELRQADGQLLGACLTDIGLDGYSAVYSFYEPRQSVRSLGTYLILKSIAAVKEARLGYLYLGYWVPGSTSMAYKSRFTPLEVLTQDGWRVRNDQQ